MKLLILILPALLISGCVVIPVDGHSGKAGGDTHLVCHKGKKTLELPHEAVQAHLNHGDHRGPC
jgi:hypothetical protein